MKPRHRSWSGLSHCIFWVWFDALTKATCIYAMNVCTLDLGIMVYSGHWYTVVF